MWGVFGGVWDGFYKVLEVKTIFEFGLGPTYEERNAVFKVLGQEKMMMMMTMMILTR